VTDSEAIRKVTPAGMVTTIAGVPGSKGIALGSSPTFLSSPQGITVDAAGAITATQPA